MGGCWFFCIFCYGCEYSEMVVGSLCKNIWFYILFCEFGLVWDSGVIIMVFFVNWFGVCMEKKYYVYVFGNVLVDIEVEVIDEFLNCLDFSKGLMMFVDEVC